jgi:hypothetical protein
MSASKFNWCAVSESGSGLSVVNISRLMVPREATLGYFREAYPLAEQLTETIQNRLES